jgi:hypothetical protein
MGASVLYRTLGARSTSSHVPTARKKRLDVVFMSTLAEVICRGIRIAIV